ncbi:hypothetical protein LEQ04_06630 [Riemerella anatipestifer]|uniref:hypothetical protein n=1 Tax=Riemerella anatipestifer TaxID=34085 RepID=UPI00129D57F8|nr:hypothetical protein [Riemerella anatipestifer]MRM85900.1 hypothetical protein [Riemerella anatipestifer]WPC10457.1 hypothetical protein LEQ05_11095 [Riemerella anatipestifer]WPC13896.1 hypothetical protein LEQ03_04540 [Riemerella anatipestifer]WPC16421.1 hypothetical protein LEQ04_06630 [Riemerella anatipestifer]
MSKLDEIHGLLPDNDNAEISEKDLRDSFSKTFEEIDAKVSKPEKDGIWGLKKQGDVIEWVDTNNYTKNIANSTLDTTKEGGVRQLYHYNWSIVQGSMFSMYAGENLGLGVEDTSFRLSNGYFNVAQGTGSGRTELTVTKNGIKLSYNINHDSDDDIYTSIGIEGGKIYFDGVNRIDEENNPEPIRQLVMDSMGWVYYKPLVQNSLQSAINGGAQATSQQRITLESVAVTGNSYYIACGFGSSTIGSFSTGNYSIFNRIDVRDNMIDMMAHKPDGFSNFQITPDGWTSSISNIAYSNFSVSRRGLNIGKGLLNNADGDITFDKILVYKADGSVGVESKPKIRRYILNRDIIVNSVPQTSTDLYVPIEPGKLYRLKACFKLGNRNTTYRFMRLYSSDLTTHYQSMGGIFQLTINSGDSGNSDIGSSNIGTHSLILEGLIRFDVSTIIKNNLVLNTSDSNLFVTLERGTYIEIEEII